MLQDIKYALRALARTPGFTTAVVLTLAIGIGANVAIFAAANVVVLRPLAYAQPEQLVRITSELQGFGATDTGTASQEFFDYRAETALFSDVAGLWPVNANVTGGDQPERVDVMIVSANYFSLLGVAPALGRVFGPQDDVPGIAPVVVVSDGFWRRRLGADPNVIGRTLVADGDRVQVVGVMPPNFRHPGRSLQSDVQLWGPAGFRGSPFAQPNRGRRFLEGCLARLQPGVTIEQVRNRLAAYGAQVRQQFAADYPARNGWAPRVVPLRTDVVGSATTPMLILLAGVSLLLLIVCANIAHLVLARASEREPEMAIRQALGASAGRLTRQLLAESVVLAAAGGVLGLLFAAWGLQLLIALAPSRVPRVAEMTIDGTTVGAAAVLTLVTALVFGLVSATRLRRSHINASAVMKEGGPGRSAGVQRARLRGGLVSAQVAIATILLVGAGLLVRTVGELLSVPIGFETANLTTARIWLPLPNDAAAGKYAGPERRASLARDLVARLGAIPGVAHAAVSTQVPMGGYTAPPFVEIEGQDSNDQRARPVIHEFLVSPGYFRALGLPIVRGRAIADADRAGADPVVVISEAAARAYWRDQNPIGTRLRFAADMPWVTVVGVAGDVRHRRLTEPAQPIMYRPFDQDPSYVVAILARTTGDIPGLAESIATSVRAVDADLPLYSVRTMDDLVAGAVAERRFLMRLLVGFGIAAVGIALLGIYGVMAYTVSRRTREIGIRMAIGARRGDVSRMVVRQGLQLTVSGLIVGLLASLGLGELMASQLFGVQPADPWTLGVVPLVMVVVSLAAAYLPARRAARVDPMVVLRGE